MSRTRLFRVSALGMPLLVLSSCDPGTEEAATDNTTSDPANWGSSGGNGSGEEGAAMPEGMHFGWETGSGEENRRGQWRQRG